MEGDPLQAALKEVGQWKKVSGVERERERRERGGVKCTSLPHC